MTRRCTYPGKLCTNPRAVKLNGKLHRLCDYHRRKANLNQKRLQQRRRAVRAQKMIAMMQRDEIKQKGALQNGGDGGVDGMDDSAMQDFWDFLFSITSTTLDTSSDNDGDRCFNDVTPQDAQLLRFFVSCEVEFPMLDDSAYQEAFASLEVLEF